MNNTKIPNFQEEVRNEKDIKEEYQKEDGREIIMVRRTPKRSKKRKPKVRKKRSFWSWIRG